MQFSKYLLAFVLSVVLAEAAEYSSPSLHSHEKPRTTLKYAGYKHRYGYEDHDRTKTTHGNTTSFMTRNLKNKIIE
jgi:hypothetical protein